MKRNFQVSRTLLQDTVLINVCRGYPIIAVPLYTASAYQLEERIRGVPCYLTSDKRYSGSSEITFFCSLVQTFN